MITPSLQMCANFSTAHYKIAIVMVEPASALLPLEPGLTRPAAQGLVPPVTNFSFVHLYIQIFNLHLEANEE